MALTKVSGSLIGTETVTNNNISDSVRESFGPRNRIINGDMRIDQRNAGAAVTNAAIGYQIDRFLSGYYGSGTGRTTVQQSSTAPTGFVNSLSVTVTTADAAPSSTFAYDLARQMVEGTNIADLDWGTANAKTITISFWVRSSVTGNFPLTIGNNAADRVYGELYTIFSANTFEYKTVEIEGDTSGTWLTTTGLGMRVSFGGGGGSDRTASVGWQTPSVSIQKSNVTGSTQLIATSGATFFITGVQLEVGEVATPFERRPFGAELALCQRYFYNLVAAAGSAASTTKIEFYYQHPIPMRATPTLNVVGLIRIEDPTVTAYNQSSATSTVEQASYLAMKPGFSNFTGLTLTRPYYLAAAASSITASPPTNLCQVSAEL